MLDLLRRGLLPRQRPVLALIDRMLGLGIGINDPDTTGTTPLHELADKELARPEDVRLLVERGADRSLRDSEGRRPFDRARVSETELREALR